MRPPLGLRQRNGEWHYRIKWRGEEFSGPTGLSAVPKNVSAAQAIRNTIVEELKGGKKPVRQIEVSLDEAVAQFNRWYRSEHQNRPCKWAVSLMASFHYYFAIEDRRSLARMNSADLEAFKLWRRENNIHDNTLRKQLLLLGQFFAYGRKHGWIKGDPFGRGEDDEVKIPSEQDSEAMHVLSPEEEARYFAAAKQASIDLADIATIMILQGPRPDEVMSLQQSHVDLFNRHFTIWDSSAEGKSKNAHRKLKMTDETFRIFARRLSKPGLWVFPSGKNSGPRTTLQKVHTLVTRGKENKERNYEGGCRVQCRLYDMRHTFATRFALSGGSLPVLAKILGHADLSLLMRYVHPSQEDMDRAMEAFQAGLPDRAALEAMLVEANGIPAITNGGPPSTFGPPQGSQKANLGRFRTNSVRPRG
jgi:integrase